MPTILKSAIDSAICPSSKHLSPTRINLSLSSANLYASIAAFKIVGNQDKLNAVGDYCLQKGKIEFAIEVFSALDNKAKLIKLGDHCFGEKQYPLSAKAYELAGEKTKLNTVAEEFMRIGLLANALRSFEAADNQMMVQFIRENFGDRDLASKVYV